MTTSKPIIIYIKTHNKTKKKYLGKTGKFEMKSRKQLITDVHNYTGSGKYWKRHLKTHGKNYSTKIIGIFFDVENCKRFAFYYSNKKDIINNKEWANLIIENGLDGRPVGLKHTEESKRKMSINTSGKKHPMFGKKHTLETKEKIRQGNKDKIISKETREKLSKINKGKKLTEEHKKKISENFFRKVE